jgi:hypothetical protein
MMHNPEALGRMFIVECLAKEALSWLTNILHGF